MKTKKIALLLGALLISVVLIAQLAAYVTAPASAMGIDKPNGISAVTALPIIDDFQTGVPATWFTYGQWDAGAAYTTTAVVTNTLLATGTPTNTVLSVAYIVAGWGTGGGRDLTPDDWTAYDGLSLWFYGSNTGRTFRLILSDNKNPVVSGDTAERFATEFTDNFSGWQQLSFPWAVFFRDGFQPGGGNTPNDGLSLAEMWAYALVPTSGSGQFFVDDIKVFKTTGATVNDFQTGVPATWFTYGQWDAGAAYTTTAVVTNTLLATGTPTNTVLAVDYIVAGWGAGGGRDLTPDDWTAYDGLSLWFYGANTGRTFRVILSDNKNPVVSGDTAERFATEFTDNFSGWQQLTFPWAVFFRDGFQPGGGNTPNDGLTLAEMWAYALVPTSGSGQFFVDDIKVFKTTGATVNDFQTGVPATWFTYGQWDAGAAYTTTAVVTNTLLTTGTPTNTVLAVDYIVAGWGTGGGRDLTPDDWTAYDGLSLWFYGSNTGRTFRLILSDNKNPVVSGDTAERFATEFTDNFSGWQQLTFPWAVFFRDGFQPGGGNTPNDGLSLAEMWAYALVPTSGSGQFFVDDIKVFGPATTQTVIKADFSSSTYSVNQGVTATVSVMLNAASAVTVTVDYSTTNGTAIAGTNYITASGTLTFTPGITTASFNVSTIGTAVYGPNKSIGLGLGNPSGAEIGVLHTPATLIIVNDNPPPDVRLIENFDGGLNSGADLFKNPLGFSTWGSTPGNVAITVVQPNSMLKVTSNIANWGGFTDAFRDGNNWTKQDWSRYDGVRFWFYGTNSGNPVQIEIFDNRELGNVGDSAERWYQRFPDDFTGWKQISLPFAQFQRRTDYQPGGAPADGLNLTDVSGFAFNLPSVASTTTYYVDLVEVYGDLSQHPATTRLGFSAYGFGAVEGQPLTAKFVLNTAAAVPVTATYVITPDTASPTFDFTGTLSGTLVFAPGETSKTVTLQTVDDSRVETREQLKVEIRSAVGAPIGYVSRSLLVIIDNDVADPNMLDDFENGVPVPLDAYGSVTVKTDSILSTSPLAVPGQAAYNTVLSVTYNIAAGATGGFTRKFDAPKDLSQADGLGFWYYGTGSGQAMTVTLLDNGQPDPGPTNWTLAWSDEFSGANGAAPNPANWNHDIGGAGWGNNEWEYYTDSRDNSALDGNGNLVITAMTNTNPALTCASSPTGPNGTCFATSARLLTAGKQEFTHGRVEARLQIPKGQGIWPAFWMLGNDIFTTNPWPASGEIDIMENIGKPSEQSTLYGTIHGPGYSGGGGIGSGPYVLTSTLADDFHVFAIEWEPTRIRWFVDGTNYFTATDTMIPAGANWVFNHPFFILLNVAVGGNWPGYPDDTTVFPQQMKIDYVRVYQAPDTAERFEATFVDNVAGWQRVYLPFNTFTRSAVQPVNAPNDGLTLTAVQGYRFDIVSEVPVCKSCAAAANQTGAFYLDDVRQTAIFKLYLPVIRR